MTRRVGVKHDDTRPLWLRELVFQLGEPAVFSDHPVQLPAQRVKRRFWVWFLGTPSRNFNISIDESLNPGKYVRRYEVKINGNGSFVTRTDHEPDDDLIRAALKAVCFGEEQHRGTAST